VSRADASAVTSQRDEKARRAPDLVDRNFTAVATPGTFEIGAMFLGR
jgi:hypothetical protein